MKDWKPELQIVVLGCCMLMLVYCLNQIGVLKKYSNASTGILTTQPE
jgi:hypothetical protein